MDLTPDELTEDERKLVDLALEVGRTADKDWPDALVDWGKESRKELRAFRNAWSSMKEESRDAVMRMLAKRSGIKDRTVLDVGAATTDFLSLTQGRRGPNIPGLGMVANTLREIWIGRGNDGTIRNLHRDLKEKRDARKRPGHLDPAPGPSDLHIFVAKHLIEMFGAETFSRNPDRVLEEACIKADTAMTRR